MRPLFERVSRMLLNLFDSRRLNLQREAILHALLMRRTPYRTIRNTYIHQKRTDCVKNHTFSTLLPVFLSLSSLLSLSAADELLTSSTTIFIHTHVRERESRVVHVRRQRHKHILIIYIYIYTFSYSLFFSLTLTLDASML